MVGDAKYFDGIGELRIDYGPGYRIHFVRRGDTVIILLCGGDKGSQKRDIKRGQGHCREVLTDEGSPSPPRRVRVHRHARG